MVKSLHFQLMLKEQTQRPFRERKYLQTIFKDNLTFQPGSFFCQAVMSVRQSNGIQNSWTSKHCPQKGIPFLFSLHYQESPGVNFNRNIGIDTKSNFSSFPMQTNQGCSIDWILLPEFKFKISLTTKSSKNWQMVGKSTLE